MSKVETGSPDMDAVLSDYSAGASPPPQGAGAPQRQRNGSIGQGLMPISIVTGAGAGGAAQQELSRSHTPTSLAMSQTLSQTRVVQALPPQLSNLDHNQIAELNEAFRMLDFEGNGIRVEDLSRIMNNLETHSHDEELKNLIQVVDQRKNGALSFGEFLLLMGCQIRQDTLDEMAIGFKHLDKKKDGTVTAMQFCELFATMGEKSDPEEVEEMLLIADPDSTGVIQYNQFLRTLAEKFQ